MVGLVEGVVFFSGYGLGLSVATLNSEAGIMRMDAPAGGWIRVRIYLLGCSVLWSEEP